MGGWLLGLWRRFAAEVGKFGAVGLVAFIVDLTLYNLAVFGLPGSEGHGPLHDIPLRAKILSTAVATVVAWQGNRHWTFRHQKRTRVGKEFLLYIVFNILGLAIALACLGFSRYALGLDSQLADNVSGNGVGLVLGTIFRFWSYRTFVFRTEIEPAPPTSTKRQPRGQGVDAIDT